MYRWTKIITIIFSLSLSSFLCGVASADLTTDREKIDHIYNNIVMELQSTSALEQKIWSLALQNDKYLLEVNKIKNESDYDYAVDLYDEVIPLLHLQLNTQKQNFTPISCNIAMGLVEMKKQVTTTHNSLIAARNTLTLSLLKKLCPQN